MPRDRGADRRADLADVLFREEARRQQGRRLNRAEQEDEADHQGQIGHVERLGGVIRVGAATETEMREKKHRVEDALAATRRHALGTLSAGMAALALAVGAASGGVVWAAAVNEPQRRAMPSHRVASNFFMGIPFRSGV